MGFQDGDNESADLKKPPTQGRTSTTKRTRAAEVHNLSERAQLEIMYSCGFDMSNSHYVCTGAPYAL
jgi:hypothetical protein